MTAVGNAIAAKLRAAVAALVELEKTAPNDVDEIVAALVAHLGSWRPVSVCPMGVLPPPSESIRDPRLG